MIFISQILIIVCLAALLTGTSHSESWTPPQRIVSLSLASDEILYELLNKTQQLSRLKGVSTLARDKRYSFLAEILKPTPHTVNQIPAQIEPVLKAKPDLIVAAQFNNPKLLHHLKSQQIRFVILSQFSSIADIKSNILMLGEMTGTSAQAQQMIANMSPVTRISRPTPPQVILYSQSGSLTGTQTLFDDMLKHIGAKNSVQDEGWIPYSLEALVKLNIDVVAAACDHPSKMITHLKKQPGWSHLKAVQRSQVICIEERALHSTSFHISKALIQLKSGLERLL